MPGRTFVLTSPHMHGTDVKNYQRLLHRRFAAWDVDYPLVIDGDYGAHTRDAGKTVAHGLGIAQAPIDAHGITPHVRDLFEHPTHRNKTELARAAARHDWLHALRQRFEKTGAELAIAFALQMAEDNVHETPAGSNRGPLIDKWNLAAGVPPGRDAYWCGSFDNACLVAGGFPNQLFLKYCPDLEAHARAGIGGWKWHPATARPERGWIVLFTEGGIAGHQELVVEDGLPVQSVGGNTSKGDGSASNGGCVARHDFGHYNGLPIRGYAQPPWHN